MAHLSHLLCIRVLSGREGRADYLIIILSVIVVIVYIITTIIVIIIVKQRISQIIQHLACSGQWIRRHTVHRMTKVQQSYKLTEQTIKDTKTTNNAVKVPRTSAHEALCKWKLAKEPKLLSVFNIQRWVVCSAGARRRFRCSRFRSRDSRRLHLAFSNHHCISSTT